MTVRVSNADVYLLRHCWLIECVLLQVNQLRLTPVRQTRATHTSGKLGSVSSSSMYSQANARTDCQPGPGQYFTDSRRQPKKQDFRRPHDPVSCSKPVVLFCAVWTLHSASHASQFRDKVLHRMTPIVAAQVCVDTAKNKVKSNRECLVVL